MDGQAYDVVHLDGIHLGHKAVVLIAWAGGHGIGWYVARRETSAAWMNLMARIGRTHGRRVRRGRRHPQSPQACMAARPRATLPCSTSAPTSAPYPARTRAMRRPGSCCAWPGSSRVSRTAAPWPPGWAPTTHGRCATRTSSTRRASGPMAARTTCTNDSSRRATPCAVASASTPCSSLWTPDRAPRRPYRPPTTPSNQSTHASARCSGDHRSLRLIHRIKAVCWWCHQHTEHPETPAWMAAHAWRDEQIERLYRQAWEYSDEGQQTLLGIPAGYGTGIDWNEFHAGTPWRNTN